MATRTAMKPITQDEFEQLVLKGQNGRVLSPLQFALIASEGEEQEFTHCQACAVFHRSGGFMIVVPKDDAVRYTVDNWEHAGSPLSPAYRTGEITIENSRGRSLGQGEVDLVDLPWEALSFLGFAPARRGAGLQCFETGGQVGRPSKSDVLTLADGWILSGGMDEDTAADYVTGEELGEDEMLGQTGQRQPAVDPDVVKAMQARIDELESMVKLAALPVPKASAAAGATPKAPGLFSTPQRKKELSEEDWKKLQIIAGPPPPRVGSVETRRTSVTAPVRLQEDLFAMVDREAEDIADLSKTMEEATSNIQDPMQRLLAAQLQQNQILLQRLVGSKPSDPVLGALAGSDNASGSGSSGGGVKGCIARDAFVRAVEDLPKMGKLTRINALKELGLSASQEDANLMKTYMERRMPLAEHRLLTYMAMMVAESWAVAYNSGDEMMLGSLSRMMWFIEQAAIDSGRLQLAWLLSGHPEPPFHMLVTRRKQPGLQAFSRLCPPSFISGNLAFLKDLDYIETRLASIGKPQKLNQDGELEEAKPPKKVKDPKETKGKGKKGKGSGGADEEGTA